MSETVRRPIELDFNYYPVAEAHRQGLAAPYRSDKQYSEADNPYLAGTAMHEAWLRGFRYAIEELSE